MPRASTSTPRSRTTDSPLFGLPNTVVTPHLGASTTEAQDKAGTAVARSVRLALQGEFVPDAVNVQAGGVVAEDVRPGLPLAEKLGRVFTAVAGGLAQSVTVDVRGKLAEFDVSVLQLAVLKGVFSDVIEEQVTYVNAPLFAEQRGLEVALTSDPESPTYRNLVTVRGAMADGRQVTVSGTLYGKNQVARSSPRSPASRSTSPPAAGCCSSPTPTGPASSAPSARRWGRPASTSPAPRSAARPRAARRSWPSPWTARCSPELLEDIAGRIGAREARAADLDTL